MEPHSKCVSVEKPQKPSMGKAERDLVALGIAAAAVIMFVGTGSAVVPTVIASLTGYGLGPDKVLVNALLLNIALIIFGWRRYRQLSDEVTERKRAEEQAKLLAETDPLTGSLNRRSFGRALDRLILEASDRDDCVAIMMIDLDNFKQVNDFNGHGTGDQILIECAHRIEALLPEDSLMSRIGGDEFACAMTFSDDDAESVDRVALAIVDAIGQPTKVGFATAEITASLGITRADVMLRGHSKHSDAQHLLDLADVAMYHAKRQGRNSYFWFEDFMADEMRFRSSMEAGIRKGLANNEFVPFYEQQIDVQTGKVTGFEMLARWQSPQFGLVKPDIFIPIAEEIGLIAPLSERLIALALKDAKQWDSRLSLAVNISPMQLRDPWFSQKLLKLLIEANFPADRLEIEITESCVHEDIIQVRSLIASLKNQGIKVSLDDFGTGYSSLSQLRMLPFDRIKIDRSFVTNLADSEDNTAILNSIAMLSKGLGLPITAEGIETDSIRELLLDYGDIKGQGYLYGQPKSGDDTHAWLSGKGLLAALTPHEERPEETNIGQQERNSAEQQQRLAGNG